MHNIWKRSLAMFMAFVMVFGMVPVQVFADDGANVVIEAPAETPDETPAETPMPLSEDEETPAPEGDETPAPEGEETPDPEGEETPAPETPHTCEFSQEIARTEATCTVDGSVTMKCSCGATSTETLTAGHKYEAAVTAPTCTAAGFTTYTCSVCGDNYTADAVDALGHNFVDGACTVCSENDPDYTPEGEETPAPEQEADPDAGLAPASDEGGKPEVTISGTLSSSLVDISDSKETFLAAEITGLNATKSVEIRLFSGETQIATTTLQNSEYFTAASLGVKIIITGESSSWNTVWNEGLPRADYVPDKMVLYVDGQAMNTTNVPMVKTNGEEAINWADVPGVNPAPKVYVAKIGDQGFETLQEALNAAAAGSGNVTVEILSDIDLTGTTWNPVTVSAPGYPKVTVNGNDKTITGLNDMLFAGTWAGGSGLIINGLTIANSTIVNDEDDSAGNVGVGAFIGFPQASATITLNNCHLVNSTVKGGHWTGGLIGYAAGYAGEDGPVFMNLTIDGCSVTGSTITGKGSAGGIIGHGTGNAWTNLVITNTNVSGNTVTSTGSSAEKAGAVIGTIGAAGQPTTVNGETKTGGVSVSATVSDNTVTSAGNTITTVYGRQGSETGMLKIAGGTYEENPIEEGVSYAAPVEGYEIKQNADGTFGIVEAAPATKTYEVATKDELDAAITAANPGDTIKLTADINYGTDHLKIEKAITLDLGGNTLTTGARNYGIAMYNGCTVTNGMLVHAGTVAAIKVWDAAEISNLEIDVTGTSSSGYDIDGIVIQENAAGVATIKNVKIYSTGGQGITAGIKTYNCGNAAEPVIRAMENVNVDVKGTALNISAPCGTATGCTFKGGENGIEIWIKGTYSASLDLADCDVTGGKQAVYAHDEITTNPDAVNNGTLKLTIDDATQLTGPTLLKKEIVRAQNVTLPEINEPKQISGTITEDMVWEDGDIVKGVTISGNVTITVKGTVTVNGTIRLSPDAISNVIFNGENNAKLIRGRDFTGQMFYAEGVSGNFQNLTFNNITLDGGAVWTGDVDKTLNRGTTNEGVKATGSVLYLVYANADLNKSTLQNHDDSTGEKANAVFLRYYSTIDFNDSVVRNNYSGSTYYRGGVVTVRQGGTVKTNNAEVYGNSGAAGGFFGISATGSFGGVAEAYNSKFHNNYSDNGAVFLMQCNSKRGYLKIDGCEFYDNASKTAVLTEWAYSRPFIISNSSFHDNECAVWDCHTDPVLDISGKIVVKEDADYTKYLFDTPLVLSGALTEGSSIAMSEASITKLMMAAGYIVTGTADYAVTETDLAKFVLPQGYKFEKMDVNGDGINDFVAVKNDVTYVKVTVYDNFPGSEASEIQSLPTNVKGLPALNFAHEGADFEGWMTSKDGTEVIKPQMFTEATKLYAKWAVNVAQVGEVKYETLAEAVAAANAIEGGATVTLLSNVTLGEKLTISGNVTISGEYTITRDAAYTGTLFTVDAGAALTLDGDLVVDGGNKWTYTKTPLEMDMANGAGTYVANHITPAEGGVNAAEHLIVNNGTLNANKVTIQNSYSTGSVSAINCGDSSVTTLNGATIQNVAANRSGAVVYVGGSDAVLTIKGDTKITANFGIGNGGIIQNYGQGTTVNMEGGSIDNNHVGKSGTLYASYSGNASKINTFNMSGGIITENVMEGYGPIYIHTNTVWNMTGGEISENTSFLPSYSRSKNNTSTISGGKIVNNIIAGTSYSNGYYVTRPDIYLGTNSKITGGIFTQDVTEYLAEGYRVTQLADGIYGVEKDPMAGKVAMIGETYYETLQAAIDAAAVTGDTITLLKDIDLTEADCVAGADRKVLFDVVGKDITLNMNDKKISVVHEDEFTNDYIVAVIRIADGAGLTVTGNGTIDVKTLAGNPDVAYMFWKRGTTGHLTIENGTYHMNDNADSMVYTNGDKIVNINGGTWTLDAVGKRENGQPWIFNAQGTGGKSILINGGTFNADINRQHWSDEAVVSEKCYVVANEDGTYTVKDGAVAYVSTGMLTGPYFYRKNVGYATLAEAVKAAVEYKDPNVTLLKDNAENIEVSGEVILNLNEKSYTGTITLTTAEATLTAPEGLNVTTNVEGSKVVYEEGTYKVAECVYIAQVGETKYESLMDALNACTNGETVELIADVTYDADDVVYAHGGATGFGNYDQYNPSIVYIGGTKGAIPAENQPSKVNAVLDLNGHTITNNADAYLFLIMDNAKLTVKDSVGTGSVNTTTQYPVLWVAGAETLVTIESGKYQTASSTGLLHSTHSGDLVITGGDFSTTADDASLLIMLNTQKYNNPNYFLSGVATVSISGGTFKGFNPEKVGDDYGASSIADIKFVDGCAIGYEAVDNGDGTFGVKEWDYQINNKADLLTFAEIGKSGNNMQGKTVKLMADIDFEWGEWYPFNFYGTFEGNDHTISNLTYIANKDGRMGFFQSIGGSAKGLTLDGIKGTVPANGRFGGFARYLNSAVEDIHVKNIEVTTTDTLAWVGGFTTYSAGGSTANCSVENLTVNAQAGADLIAGFITLTSNRQLYKNSDVKGFKVTINDAHSSGCGVGGFAAQTQTGWNNPKFENCDITGIDVTATGLVDVGGFIAWPGAHTEYANNCTTEGKIDVTGVTSESNFAGGFFGHLGWNCDLGYMGHVVNNCSANVDIITKVAAAGGFVGSATNSNTNSMYATFNSCSASGDITCVAGGTAPIGGFAGNADRGVYNKCSATGTVTNNGTGATGGFIGEVLDTAPKYDSRYPAGTRDYLVDVITFDTCTGSAEPFIGKVAATKPASELINKASYVAQVGETYYATFDAALAAAKASEAKTMTLLATVVLTEDTTLDLGGVTIKTVEKLNPAFRIVNSANVTVKNGTMETDGYCFILGASDGSSAGNLTIEDGTYTGKTSVASVTKGTLAVNGGTYAVTGDYGTTYLLNCIDANYKDGSAAIVVKGGTFKGFNPADNAAEGTGTSFLAEGYTSVAGDNNVWTVEKAKVYVAAIGETKYESLAEAIKAANATEGGATVTLLANATIGEALAVSGNVTIDGANFIITWAEGYNGTLFNVTAGASLTTKNLTIDGENAFTFYEDTTPVENGQNWYTRFVNVGEEDKAVNADVIVNAGDLTLGADTKIQNVTIASDSSNGKTSNTETGGYILMYNDDLAIIKSNGGKVTIAGEISGNAGLVLNAVNAESTISGKIIGNMGAGNKGGIVIANDGAMTITGSISNNKAMARSATVLGVINGAEVTFSGTMDNNKHIGVGSNTAGSIVCLEGASQFVMNGGSISKNIGGRAGAIASRWVGGSHGQHEETSIVLNAGTVTGNTASNDSWNGASIYLRSPATIGEGMKIDGTIAVNAAPGELAITGGTINDSVNNGLIVTDGLKAEITGGTFNYDPTKWCAKGYKGVKTGENTWTVKEADPIAEVNGTKYYSLTDALNACTNGETVNLIADVTYTEADVVNAIGGPTGYGDYPNPSIVYIGGTKGATPAENQPSKVNAILDLNGHTITNNADAYLFLIMDNAKLTIKDSGNGDGIIGNGKAPVLWVTGTETVVTIESGKYTVDNYGSLMWATHSGDLVITGGEFSTSAADASSLIMRNEHNRQNSQYFISGKSTVTVKGGTFEGFNPEKMLDDSKNPAYEFDAVAPNYKAIENNGVYEVVDYIQWIKDELLAGNDMKLEKDIVVDGSMIESIPASTNGNGKYPNYAIFTVIGDEVTFDLNGHTITYNGHKDFQWKDKTYNSCTVAHGLFYANAGAHLTVADSSEEKTGTVMVYGLASGAYVASNDTKFTITGGTWINKGCAECGGTNIFLYPLQGGELYIKGGHFDQALDSAGESYLMVVHGGEYKNSVIDYSKTKIEISGGTFVGMNPDEVKYFQQTADNKLVTGETTGAAAEGMAGAQLADGSYTVKPLITVTFDNVTMVDGNELPEFTYTTNFTEVAEDGEMLVVGEPVVNVNGTGEYEIIADASVFMSDKYVVRVTPGTLTVKEAVVEMDGIKYATIKDALATLKSADTTVHTVKVLKDHEIDVNYSTYNYPILVNGFEIVLDLNGKTITADWSKYTGSRKDNSLIGLVNGGKLTVTGDGTIRNMSDGKDDVENRIFWLSNSHTTKETILTIENGTFIQEEDIHLLYVEGNLAGNSKMGYYTYIKGGHFEMVGYNDFFNSYDGRTQETVISGGTFNVDPTDWETKFPKGYKAEEIEEGIWGVVPNMIFKLHLTDPTTGEPATIPYIEGNDLAKVVADGKPFYANYYNMKLEVLGDWAVEDSVVIDYPMTIDLGKNTVSADKTLSGKPVFRILSDVTVTNGTVDGTPGNSSYAFIVGNSTTAGELTIADGTYKGRVSAISITNGTANISGGYFEATEYNGAHEFTLNCIDAAYKNGTAKFNITGGSFYKFNPENNAAEGANTNFVTKYYLSRESKSESGEPIFTVVPVDIKINQDNMELGNSLALQFWVKKSEMKSDMDYTAKLVREFADGTTETVLVPESDWISVKNNGVEYYKVKYANFAAKEMTDEISIQILDANGTVVSNTFTDSIREYAMICIEYYTTPAYAEFRTAMVDMLNYGAAAQKQFGYKTDDPANNQLTAEQQALATKSVTLNDHWSMTGNGYSSNLELVDNIVLHIWFNDVSSDMYAEVSYTNHYNNQVMDTVTFAEFKHRGGSVYSVPVDELVVADGNQVVTCELYNGNNELVGTVTESINSYLKAMIDYNLDANGLYDATAKFTTSSYNYFH